MHVTVNGTRLFFDVTGPKLIPDGPRMRERPTLLLLHGGPGGDHSMFRPRFDELSDIAQIIYLDHRGNGRSERGWPEDWTLAQWGDDVRAFCDALGITRPVVCGTSFGGMVAMAYATRHPGHAGALTLVSTCAEWSGRNAERVAMFRQLGGDAAGRLAQRRFIDGDSSPEVLAEFRRVCLPLYTRRPADAAMWERMVGHDDVTAWFNRPGEGEVWHFDFRAALARVTCPTLLMAGTRDPMTPVACQRDLAAALTRAPVEAIEFEGCGHGVVTDAPEPALAALRRFVQGQDRQDTSS